MLFRETHGSVLVGLEPGLVDMLLRQQLAGQTMSYASHYPGARIDIVESSGVPIGRIVVAEADTATVILDIALLVAWRGRGIGTRLIRSVIDATDAASRPVRLSVLRSNAAAMRLYKRLGFFVTSGDDVRFAMERRPTLIR